MTTLDVLKAEIRRLRRDQSGIALMVTLSVFLLLYTVCAGVYAIGETVRQKVELQNACDAAAYSAAVVQADGLSRMAMINRAMSWTYVQLTNMQIDYITHKWMSLVTKRFGEDKAMCKNYNSGTKISSIAILTHRCKGGDDFKKEGIGWFCGAQGESGRVVLNYDCESGGKSRTISSMEADCRDVSETIEKYKEMIPKLKQTIASFNLLLPTVYSSMMDAAANTLRATLWMNLPRDGKGEIDADLARDFLAYDSMAYSANPYDFHDEDGIPTGWSCFSPLYNTELDERLFLTMADGEVHSSLLSYFGESGSNSKKAGGLDQWFVRGWEGDSANSTEARIGTYRRRDSGWDVEDADGNRLADWSNWKTLCNAGICRVYRNANLQSRADKEKFRYRAHHASDKDTEASVMNVKARWPDMCRKVADSTALYADYEWCSARYDYHCVHFHDIKECEFHIHWYSQDYLGSCNGGHRCEAHGDSQGSHSRAEYKSCYAKKKKKMSDGVTFSDEFKFLEQFKYALDLPGCKWGCGGEPLGGGWSLMKRFAQMSLATGPNGFARIYGDDAEIYDSEYYCGIPAMPWILNENFYGSGGAMIAGLARKVRNPWTWLLHSVADVLSGDLSGEERGIYSMFDPKDEDRYMVAFSAARAAHRVAGRAHGEYETRYDAVCERDGRFSVESIDDYHVAMAARVFSNAHNAKSGSGLSPRHPTMAGCVCGSGENENRFSRNWNLCETDWDATLLPLKFAWAKTSALYDSLSDESVEWTGVGLDANGLDPVLDAVNSTWTRLYTDDGELVTSEMEGMDVSGVSIMKNADGLISRRVL